MEGKGRRVGVGIGGRGGVGQEEKGKDRRGFSLSWWLIEVTTLLNPLPIPKTP